MVVVFLSLFAALSTPTDAAARVQPKHRTTTFSRLKNIFSIPVWRRSGGPNNMQSQLTPFIPQPSTGSSTDGPGFLSVGPCTTTTTGAQAQAHEGSMGTLPGGVLALPSSFTREQDADAQEREESQGREEPERRPRQPLIAQALSPPPPRFQEPSKAELELARARALGELRKAQELARLRKNVQLGVRSGTFMPASSSSSGSSSGSSSCSSCSFEDTARGLMVEKGEEEAEPIDSPSNTETAGAGSDSTTDFSTGSLMLRRERKRRKSRPLFLELRERDLRRADRKTKIAKVPSGALLLPQEKKIVEDCKGIDLYVQRMELLVVGPQRRVDLLQKLFKAPTNPHPIEVFLRNRSCSRGNAGFSQQYGGRLLWSISRSWSPHMIMGDDCPSDCSSRVTRSEPSRLGFMLGRLK